MPSRRLCSWTSWLVSASAAVSLAVGITTPVRSGPNCGSGCVAYPYTDAAAFVPRDYLWMYPAIATVVAFLLLAVGLYEWMPPDRRWLSRAGLLLAAMGAGVLVVDYGLQLTVLQPGLLSGETAGLTPLSQYNPSGVFIGLENVGYVVLSLALLFLGAGALRLPSRSGRAAAWLFLVGAAATLALLVLYAAIYRAELFYRFEVLALGITWLVLIVGGALLGVAFRPGARWTTETAAVGDAAAGNPERADGRSALTKPPAIREGPHRVRDGG
jgi:hypothetical protein